MTTAAQVPKFLANGAPVSDPARFKVALTNVPGRRPALRLPQGDFTRRSHLRSDRQGFRQAPPTIFILAFRHPSRILRAS